MNLTVETGNKEAMWSDEDGARSALVEAALLGPGIDDKSWTCALTAMWCLAVEPGNRTPMWEDVEGVRAAVLKAAMTEQGASDANGRARERALGTLQYLATEKANQSAMWHDEATRMALVKAAALSDPAASKMRGYALAALWNLSSCAENKTVMWQEQSMMAAIHGAIEDRARSLK